jgi:lipopolysaccharide export system permease protein
MRFFKPGILDRYIWRQVLSSTVSGVLMLTGVMVLGNVFKEMERLLGDTAGLPLLIVLQFIGYVVPYSLIFTIPWALLTAILLVFGRLSADNEMTALRMTGRSMLRICAPVFLLAALCSIVCYFVNVRLAPYAKNQIKGLFSSFATDQPETLFQPGKMLDKVPDYRIFVGEREGRRLKDVIITQTDGASEQQFIRARSADIVITPGVTDFVLRLQNAKIEKPKKEGNIDVLNEMGYFSSRETPITFPLSKLKEKTERVTPDMKDTSTLWTEVRTGINSVTEEPATPQLISASLTEVNMRFSFSLACLTFTLVGIPLGITAQRRETSVGFALSLIVATSYIVFILFAKSSNERPGMYPHLLMWLPNVLFIGVGVYLFRKLMRK